MEENPWELNPNSPKFSDFLEKTLSSLSSDPLFSTIITLYTLILLYFPRFFLGIVFSPVIISTGILLLIVLRLGAIQRDFDSAEAERTDHDDRKWVSPKSNSEPESEMGSGLISDPDPFYAESFVEWNVRAPLEVIYEAYEGEEDERNHGVSREEGGRVSSIERYPSLSMYYPESDPESSSDGDFPLIGDWESPESMGFRWDEEDGDGLIEISLDGKRKSESFHFDEENLIEIDISPARNGDFPGEW